MRRKRKHSARQGTAEGAAGDDSVKVAKPVNPGLSLKPLKMLRQVIQNPNLSYQIMVILLALTGGDGKMERRIDTMTTSVDSLRGITDVLTNSMQSLRTAAEAPKRIRSLIKPNGNGSSKANQ
ncbi:MAG: hypothetical protein H6Q74_1778 [Firmicutes bacterium]|nr:hypothetical protein [Bacillota bacterium]